MHLFRYARDYYGEAAQQLLWDAALLFFAIVGGFVAVHLLRRSAGIPFSTQSYEGKLPPDARIVKYELGARLYHWGNILFVFGLAISGMALFRPPSLGRGPWLLIHEAFGVAFIAGLVLHTIVAPLCGEAHTMWFERRDWRDLRMIVGNFVGSTREYPVFGNYDPWQKLYHAFIALLSVALVFSGACLMINAQVWATFSHPWMRDMRLVHDLSAFMFLAIIVGHIYFGLIRANWPELVAMVTGSISGSGFNRHHSTIRWQPRQRHRTDR
jgi:cytochrome b subunit of formate dehydrogenase